MHASEADPEAVASTLHREFAIETPEQLRASAVQLALVAHVVPDFPVEILTSLQPSFEVSPPSRSPIYPPYTNSRPPIYPLEIPSIPL